MHVTIVRCLANKATINYPFDVRAISISLLGKTRIIFTVTEYLAQSRRVRVSERKERERVYVPSSIFNVRARHTEHLIRYLSVHFVDSVEIPNALSYASYSAPRWHHPRTYK